MTRGSVVSALLCSAAAWLVLTGAEPVFAADAEPSHSQRLVAKARTLSQRLDRDPRQLSIHLEFEERRGWLRGAVYSIVEQHFETVRESLGHPASWCEILSLHFNVKSCTHGKRTGDQLLTLYLGRKFYSEAGGGPSPAAELRGPELGSGVF